MSDYELENKVAIVTGGAGGIGTHISHEYARAGAAVVVASRNQDRIDAVVRENARQLAVVLSEPVRAGLAPVAEV